MLQSRVFISYSRADEMWVDRMRTHIHVGRHKDSIHLWDDRSIAPGEMWQDQLEEAIASAGVAILVISADYLASDFISYKELPTLLHRRQEEGLVILPILVRPCLWHEVEWLRSIQFWPKDAKPISSLPEHEVDKSLADFATFVVAALERTTRAESATRESTSKPGRETTPTSPKDSVFISHAHEDGDFAELLQLRIEKEGFSAWVDLEGLTPGTDWRTEIDEGIRGSLGVVVVMSPSAKESEYVTYEWAFALGVGVAVIPILLWPTQLHPRIDALQFLDFTNRAARPWDRLITTLKGLRA